MNTFTIITILSLGVLCSCTNTSRDSKANNVSDVETPEKNLQGSEGGQTMKIAANVTAVAELPIEKVFELQQSDSILLVDTRPTIFYQLGHIDGAISIPIKTFDAGFVSSRALLDDAVREGKKIVIYCQSESCPSSHKMAGMFVPLGYSTSVFKGGWELWKASGL